MAFPNLIIVYTSWSSIVYYKIETKGMFYIIYE